MFRRFKPKYYPLNIQYAPPPDGTYPPRLLLLKFENGRTQSFSVWLNDGETQLLIENEASLRRDGLTYTIIPLNTLMSELKVNGQALGRAQKLKDGDFVQWRNIRAIFRVDPVKDHRVRMETFDLSQRAIPSPAQKLRRRVLIQTDKISLDGGLTYAHWDEIIGLFLQIDVQAMAAHIEMPVTQSDEKKPFQHDLMGLNYTDADDILNWLYLTIPFDLSASVLIGKVQLADWFPDAYFAAALEKIIQPAKIGRRMLPADENYVLGILSRRDIWIYNLKLLITLITVLVGFAILLGIAVNVFGNETVGRLMLLLIGISMFYVIFVLIRGAWKSLRWEYRLWRNRASHHH